VFIQRKTVQVQDNLWEVITIFEKQAETDCLTKDDLLTKHSELQLSGVSGRRGRPLLSAQ
jgi:hypothetical protein